MSTVCDMSFWSHAGSPKVSDVSVDLDDIIKRLAAGDNSEVSSEAPDADNNNVTHPDKVKCPEKCENVPGYGEKLEESGAEIVCGVQDGQCSSRPASELVPTINTDDVTSRDTQPKPNPCLTNACSEGSYSRRKHHKHHKHKHRHSESPAEAAKPKINPVFVWIRQEDCRIVEVMCEDYDRRNRLRLAKTPLGWRAIPKTEIFSTAVIPKAPKPPKSERRKKRKKSRTKTTKQRKDSATSLLSCPNDSLTLAEDEADGNSCVEISPDERIRREVKEEIVELSDSPISRMIKSSSCNFKTSSKKSGVVRSTSLNFKLLSSSSSLCEMDKSDDEVKEDSEDSRVLDMTKHGELNETDCDELGMLLKEIPNLEDLVEEDEIEDSEFEEITIPKDLTLPKPKNEERVLPKLPPGISSVVTVTSSSRPPQPLTAPLPEVTITPIPNPKPAHQQKSQNKYLESLLSTTRLIKPERDEVTITRTKAPKRAVEPHECEITPKKVKVEDITLKNLLSKQPFGSEKNQRLDAKSRLQELLTTEPGDPIAQLKQVLSNPNLSVPDPLLVPRARLPALVASPASEIPRLLLDKQVVETPRPPQNTDPDTLVVSLAHLRSLLAYKSTNTEDITAYQKNLEAFLEWQRYQTGIMESQIKNTPPLTPGDIDMATANAFNQMLWLPYLNLDSNRDLMSMLNTVCSPYGQSSPFLTPTSPMESHMKTIAMWQDAVMSQQGANMKLPSPGLSEPALKIPTPGNTPRRRGPNQVYSRANYEQMFRQQSQFELHRKQQQQHHRQIQQQRLLDRQRQQLEQQHLMQMQQYQQQYNSYEMGKNMKQDYERKPKTSPALSIKPLQNMLDRREAKKANASWYQFEEDVKKHAGMTNEMAKQWQQFEEEMRKSQIQISRKKIKTEAKVEAGESPAPPEEKKPPIEAEVKSTEGKGSSVPKLKVKDLSELSRPISPAKLLKEPEHLLSGSEEPVPEDTQAHLWHPLFGSSNQMRGQSYNSGWRWTTLTVNGE